MRLIGVTGGIGAGKTTVLSEFERLGYCTLDADDVVHRLYEPGMPVYEAVAARWGVGVIQADGSLDRAAVAGRVFGDPAELSWLNSLIHPLVRGAFRDLSERTDGPLFCGVPLLFEVGWQDDMDATVAVWCDLLTQRRRLHDRGWSDEDIRRRLGCQMSMDEKLSRADVGIINTGSRLLLAEQCEWAIKTLRETSGFERKE